MSRRLVFLGLIGLMLFVLAIAGQDGSRLFTPLGITSVKAARIPASEVRTLDIEPVLPGAE